MYPAYYSIVSVFCALIDLIVYVPFCSLLFHNLRSLRLFLSNLFKSAKLVISRYSKVVPPP